MSWQTIDTAPKDGTELLLSDGRKLWFGRWRHSQTFELGKLVRESAGWTNPWAMLLGASEEREPTHWQLPPALPEQL